ncbi:MAG: type I methionyl aminopeptidase [Candidatus Shapirobacteria bacterium]
MVIIKTSAEINGIKKSCRLAAATLKYLADFIKPGVSTLYLNDLGHQYIIDHMAVPAPLGYEGYPKSICTSINNVVCHGIPSGKEILKTGDIINLDVTTILNGYFGDVSATYSVGKISPEASLLLERTQKSLELSIAALKPGKLLNDCVGKVIEPYISQFGYSVIRLLGGHGIGLKFHEDPFVFHFDTKEDDVILKPGMIFTIEPMINISRNWQVTIDKKDGWTVCTIDGALSCQFEHTVLITKTGSETLTKL